MYWIILILSIGFSWYIGWKLKKRFKEYSEITLAQNLSGKDVAEKMLRDNGITDVKVISVEGELTDHYNPINKTVNLSPDVYYGRNVSAAAVAAHECGHAIQHAHSYAWLTMRSKLVPLQNVSAQVINAVFIIMFIGSFFVHGLFPLALPIIIFCYFIFTVFAFITLPVEMDASRRALVWLSSTNITNDYMHSKAEDALKWAARTYLVAALSSLSMLIYYVMVYLSNRD
ncbi:MAG TPA: zinc metallopeptidase [Bacteroidales bacterium]|nr:zinc metallopeptidase [Bacteroidales bacterium]